MLKLGMIIHSKSPWSSPVRLVRKKDGSMRITVDFRKVNNATVKDAYPIPLINNMLNHLAKGRIFTTLDLHSGYYQVKMDEASRKYTAFACDYGFFEYTVMPMGLTNATGTFQRLMDKVLNELIGKICYVYLDDIIIFSENEQEHMKHVDQIVERLKQHNLKINLKKCTFAQRKIEYLSHIICNGTISPRPAKLEALYRSIVPKSVKQVQSFLGLASYYRKFIESFSTIASPLIQCTEGSNDKQYKFTWTVECQAAFDKLRSIITSDKILLLPDFEQPFRIETDASNYGVGAVLSQQCPEKHWKPVAFFSKHLNKAQRNYSASEKELLAIVLGTEHFKQFVYGRPFQVITDHQPLKYLLTTEDPAPRLARWFEKLKMYDCTIEYRKGTKNGNADALSRMVDVSEIDDDEPEIHESFLINAIHIENNKTNPNQLEDEDIKWYYDLKKEFTAQPKEVEIKEQLKNVERISLYKQWNRIRISGTNLFREFTDQNDFIRFQYIVPKHERNEILRQSHDSIFSGHLGYDKTIDRISQRFYWPKVTAKVKEYIESCTVCQTSKTPNRYHEAPMKFLQPSKAFEIVTSDLMGPTHPVTKRVTNIF